MDWVWAVVVDVYLLSRNARGSREDGWRVGHLAAHHRSTLHRGQPNSSRLVAGGEVGSRADFQSTEDSIMGWASGTDVFDAVAREILGDAGAISKTKVILALVEALEDNDWDTQNESEFYDHPIVRRVMRELHPDWDE